jgi:Cu/Ag efflux protein CusF
MNVGHTAFFSVVIIGLFSFPAQAQQPSSLLGELDRAHVRIPPDRHVHSRGRIESVDIEQGTVTMWHWELGSLDKSVWMPAMRMVFHVTNRSILRGLNPGDEVTFQATRLRNALMITKIRKN